MAFWIRLWPFGKKSGSQASNPSSTPGSAQSPTQPQGSGLFKRAGTWVGETFEDSAKQASVILRRTGQAVAREALTQATVKLLISRMQRDLEAHATICREQIATLRQRRFASREALGMSYLQVFTLTDELRRSIISYAEALQRPDLAQFYMPTAPSNASTSGASTANPPAGASSSAVVLIPESTELAALAPALVFPDPKNMGRGYIKRRATALAEIYQQMLRTMQGVEQELHKARRISELELITLVRRLNLLFVQLLQEEVAFGLEMKKGEPAVVARLEDLFRNLSGL